MRLIDADKLLDEIKWFESSVSECKKEEVRSYIRRVEAAPTVDAVPVVHGRWLSAYEYGLKLGITDAEALEGLKKDTWWKFCKDCGEGVKGSHNYCPNCGADMRGSAEDG